MKLWTRARNKDEKAVLAILARTEKSIYAAIHRYARKPVDIEEAYAQGVLVVLECIEAYEEQKGVPFLAYVHTRLKYHYLKSWSERICDSLDKRDPETGIATVDQLCATDDTEAEFLLKEEHARLRRALSGLTAKERKCVEGYYLHGLSLSEIAHSLGIAYRTACNNKTRGMKKLKTMLTKEEGANR